MKIKIQTISAWNLFATVFVVVMFIVIYGQGAREFQSYQDITEEITMDY